MRVVSAVSVYDPERRASSSPSPSRRARATGSARSKSSRTSPVVDPRSLYGRLQASSGGVYNAEAVEKSVENLSIEVARRGYPFAVVRPRGDRDLATATINIVFTVDDGPRVYIERINIRGNTRTRDYVIRREFDVGEGDAYNRALDRSRRAAVEEPQLFQDRQDHQRAGLGARSHRAQRRCRRNADRRVLGLRRLLDRRRLDGRTQRRRTQPARARASTPRLPLQYGQCARGFELSFAEPFFLGTGLASASTSMPSRRWRRITFRTTAVPSVWCAARRIRAERRTLVPGSLQHLSQKITLPSQLNNCMFSPNALINGGTGVNPTSEQPARPIPACASTGWQLLRQWRSLACRPQGAGRRRGARVDARIHASPTTLSTTTGTRPAGLYAEFKQDFAGVGGDVNFIRTTVDTRTYYEMFSDVVGVLHLQGGHITGWGGRDLRMLDHFQMGPNLVRGFAPSGIGPRDLTHCRSTA